MKVKLLLAALCLAILAAFTISNTTTHTDTRQPINPVLGDASFESTFGQPPTAATNEQLRIQTHLKYVEGLLREKDVSALNEDQQASRTQLLDLLRNYWSAGVFPKNYDHPTERKPCFIDRDGNVCAVGYLVEQTAGLEVAQQINSLFQYANIYDMELPALSDWVAASGFTLEEVAMIQPTYGAPSNPSQNYIEPRYGIATAVVSGANITMSALNASQLSRPGESKAAQGFGMLFGAGQVAWGIVQMPEEQFDWGGNVITNESQKTLSLINIGVGSTTMFLSLYNLLANRTPRKDPKTSWNLYSYPTRNNDVGVQLGFTRRI